MLNHREQSLPWKMSQNYALWATKSWGLLTPTPTKTHEVYEVKFALWNNIFL